jgi:hypothetical protein
LSASAQGAVAAGRGHTVAAPMRGIYRYGAVVNSHDLLKVLAILVMVIDHTGNFFVDNSVWMRLIGRMAAPLFFFMVGYSGSYRFKWQILILGVALSTISFLTSTANGIERILPLNILLSFVLIKLILDRFDPAVQTAGFLVTVFVILMVLSIPTYIFMVEYGSLGLCYAIGARLLSQRHSLARLWICITVGVHFLFETVEGLIWNPVAPASILPYAIPFLAAVFGATLVILLNYRFRTFDIKYVWIRTPVIYVSRYSLQVYFFHLAAFMIIYRLI